MTFFKICLKSFQIFSSVLKEFLHNQTKYDINWGKKKNFQKIMFVSKNSLDPDPDPDPDSLKKLDPDPDSNNPDPQL